MIALAITYLASAILFSGSLSYFFFQDDWFVLNWVRNSNFLSLFAFREDIIYWRPISMPLLFLTIDKLFTDNPLAFHLVSFFLFLILIFLVYRLMISLEFNHQTSSIVAFLYGSWPIHYISLSWFSTTSYIIGPIFQILALIMFISASKTQKIKNYIISVLLFLLGVASSEFTLVLPVIFAAYLIYKKQKIQITYFLPFAVIIIIYIVLRLLIFPIPAKGEYELSLNFQPINNYFWYLLWALGFPETFKTLIFASRLVASLKILLDFWQVTVPIAAFVVLITLTIITQIKKHQRLVTFGIVWFTVGLLPIIFLTKHAYPVYLSFAGLGLLIILAASIRDSPRFLIIKLLSLWLLVSYTNLKFTSDNHWINNVQATSRAYIDYVLTNYPNPPPNSHFVFRPPNINFARNHDLVIVEGEHTIKFALSDQNAMQVIYGDQSIKSIFLASKEKINLPTGAPIIEISPTE